MAAKETSYLAHDKQFRKILKELLNNTDRIMRNALPDYDGDVSLADGSVDTLISHAKRVLNAGGDEGYPQNTGATAQSHPQLLHAYLSQCVRDQLSTAVRHEAEQAVPSSTRDAHFPESQVVDTCVRHLLESPQYRSFVTDLQTAIARVTEHMTLDYFSLAAPEGPEQDGAGSEPGDPEEAAGGRWSGNFSHGGSVSSLADGESVSSSSYGAFWEMLSNDQLQDLADRLGSCDTAARLEALRTLAALPIGEVVVFDNWPFMRSQLRRLLAARDDDDDDAALYECALHVHAKMLRGGGATSFCTAEGYANVAEALRHAVDRLSERGVVSTPPTSELDAVLRLAKLANTFQRVAPRYWVRFADQHSLSVVADTVKHLFDVHPGPATRPTPLHFLALLDPQCVALRAWTKGEYGRRLLIGVLRKHPRVLPGLIDACESYFGDVGAEGTDRTGRPGSPHGIEWNHVRHCHVLFVVNFVGALLRGSEGRQLVDGSVPAEGRHFLLDRAWPAAISAARTVGSCGTFCLALAVGSVLERVCTDDAGCTYCFSDHRSVGAVLDVLVRWLQPDRRCDTDSDVHVLFHAVAVLETLTESCVGLRFLLDHRGELSEPSVSGVELVARFTEQLFLLPDLTNGAAGDRNLLEETRSALVAVGCRILATHEGLQRLQRSQLLRRMAEEWESQLHRGESTPVAGQPLEQKASPGQRDWLAYMATVGRTPLGVAALRDANLLQDVLDWTERELLKVKQVSGLSIAVRLMLSQVAAACCAEPRLAEPLSPAVDLLADVIWSACDVRCLDGGPPDSLTPASQESLELHARQTLADLLCILAPRMAVTSALMTPPGAVTGSDDDGETDDTERSSGLVNLVVSAVDGSTPSDDLAAETGLKLLSALGASLDTWLHLQGRHRLLEALLDAQLTNVTEGNAVHIVDNLALRRGRLLAKMSEIGGEREKLLPPVTEEQDFVDVEHVHQAWPFVVSLPLPDQYLPALPPLSRAPLETELFLRETRAENLDRDWLVYCCEVFRNCLLSGGGGGHEDDESDDGDEETTSAVQFRGQWYGHLLFFALAAATAEDSAPATNNADLDDALVLRNLTPADHVGCQLVVSYGIRLGLLLVDEQAVDDLSAVLQSMPVADNELGFDWLSATIFLLMCGNRERTLAFRRRLDQLPLSHRLVDWKVETSASNSWLRFCHNVEIVLIGNHPLVFHALERSGLSVGQICYPWLRQCFWNVLDWEEICGYLGLCFVMGRDYQIYFVVAIFRHLQKEVLKAAKDGNMALFFCETRLQGFRARDYLPFMECLESKYRNLLNLNAGKDDVN